MSGTMISVLILVAVFALVVFAYIAQTMETARKERHRQMLLRRQRCNSINQLITSLPTTYLSESIYQFLLSYQLSQYQQMKQLEPDLRGINALITTTQERLNTPYESNPDDPSCSLASLLEAQNTRSNLKELVDFFISLNNEGGLDTRTTQQLIQQSKQLYRLAFIDIQMITARQYESSDNPKLALAQYDNALKKLERLNVNGAYNKRYKHLEGLVNTLREAVLADATTQQEKLAEKELLQQEWDSYNEQEDDWTKKKNFD